MTDRKVLIRNGLQTLIDEVLETYDKGEAYRMAAAGEFVVGFNGIPNALMCNAKADLRAAALQGREQFTEAIDKLIAEMLNRPTDHLSEPRPATETKPEVEGGTVLAW
jgi:hypothetical protein